MVKLFKENKALGYFVVGLSGFALLAVAVFFILQPIEGQTFVTYAAPMIGVAVDRNGVVADIQPGSPAEQAGILPGDVFKQVGATTLTSGSNSGLQEKFRQEIHNITTLKDGSLVTTDLPIIVSRNGQTLHIVVKAASPPFNFTPSNRIPVTATPIPASADWVYI